jgi:hypothetical protein
MSSALERRERAVHRGESDVVFFIYYRCDGPCLSVYDLHYVATADAERLIRRPQRIALTLSPSWKDWVRPET